MKGRLMTCRGRHEEALTCLEAAYRLNPLRSRWSRPLSGIALFSLRRFEEAHPCGQTDAGANPMVGRAARGVLRPAWSDSKGTGSHGGGPAAAAQFLDGRIHAQERFP